MIVLICHLCGHRLERLLNKEPQSYRDGQIVANDRGSFCLKCGQYYHLVNGKYHSAKRGVKMEILGIEIYRERQGEEDFYEID